MLNEFFDLKAESCRLRFWVFLSEPRGGRFPSFSPLLRQKRGQIQLVQPFFPRQWYLREVVNLRQTMEDLCDIRSEGVNTAESFFQAFFNQFELKKTIYSKYNESACSTCRHLAEDVENRIFDEWGKFN